MAKATVYYLLNEEGRKQSILTGGTGKEVQVLNVEATKEILDLAEVNKNGEVTLIIGATPSFLNNPNTAFNCGVVADYQINTAFNSITTINQYIRFDKPQTVESLLASETLRLDALAIKKAEIDRKLEMLKEREMQELKEKERQKEQARREKQQKKADIEQEKARWIESYGSEWLKKAYNGGYNSQRLYIKERAEHDEVLADFDNCADWEDRTLPSEDGLDLQGQWESLGFNCKVVWLITPPKFNAIQQDENYGDTEDYNFPNDDFEECEALWLEDYAGKYDAFILV